MSCNAVTISQQEMQTYYYGINPPKHAEKAYQPRQGDKYPTLSSVPTTAGASGDVVLLVTSLFNRAPFGRAEAQVVDYDSLVKYNGGTFPTPEQAQKIIAQHPDMVAGHCSGTTPFRGVVQCEPHSRVTVRVMTGGTMAKALSREDYTAGGGKL